MWGKRRTAHKFKATKVFVGGESFPSKLEYALWNVLKTRELAGEIKDIKRQVNVRLKEKCEACGDGPVDFSVDFSFTDVNSGATQYAEAKGVRVSSYIKREKLWVKNPPGRLEVWGGSYKRPKLLKVIE
jgi:hypothetical protein